MCDRSGLGQTGSGTAPCFTTSSILWFIIELRSASFLLLSHSTKNNGQNPLHSPSEDSLHSWDASTSKTSFVTGRLSGVLELATLRFTFRTSPSSLGNTSITLPIGHLLRGESSSIISTMSLTARFRLTEFHLGRSWDAWRYSFLNRFQNSFARYCTALHRFRQYMSAF